jgi:hypothetical protein
VGNAKPPTQEGGAEKRAKKRGRRKSGHKQLSTIGHDRFSSPIKNMEREVTGRLEKLGY